jgi:outer membrane protein insertion porin family
MTNYITYFESKSGASVAWSRWLSEYVNASVSFFAEELTYKDPQAGICPDQIPLICSQLGSQSSTGFRTSLFRDTRDYYLDPRTGWRFMVGVDYGTPTLGGTNHFYKYYVDVIKYTPLLYDTRFSVRARYGVAEGVGDKPIPLTERFFVGGINTMRGFVFGRAGPVTPSGSLLGAAKELIFNNDFIFTISSEAKLNGVLFFDYGKGFNDNEPVDFNLRAAAGIEARWISPFGPLRAAYGINLDPNPNERKGVFEFTIGSLF